jgi:hypothetical protein
VDELLLLKWSINDWKLYEQVRQIDEGADAHDSPTKNATPASTTARD